MVGRPPVSMQESAGVSDFGAEKSGSMLYFLLAVGILSWLICIAIGVYLVPVSVIFACKRVKVIFVFLLNSIDVWNFFPEIN